MSAVVSLRHERDLAIVTADNPPVNALSHAVRVGLQAAFEQAAASGCRAIVLNCAGRTFFAGARSQQRLSHACRCGHFPRSIASAR